MKKTLSILIGFLIWAVIFFTQAACSVGYGWILLTMFFVSYPLSGWAAKKVTGLDPYKLMLP